MTRARVIRIATAFAAAGFVALSAVLPLWSMTMRAPQYPKGLRLYAYGTGMSGDLRELTILNHYIGMPPIAAPAAETAMFPIGIALLVGLCVIAPLHRWLRRIAVVAIAAVPLGILVDLQWRLYEFGHTLNPTAPIRLKPFTPLVLGSTKMGNFTSTAIISTGFACFVAAALCLWLGARFGKRHEHPMRVPASVRRAAAAAVLGAIAIVPAARLSATQPSLQARIDAARPGTTLRIERGVHRGPVVIHGPLTVLADQGAVIDGGGSGSVVTIQGDEVVFRGFTVRNSGRDVTEEAAGITATGNRHLIESNRVENVYFGIHIGAGSDSIVRQNTIVPGLSRGERPGHGINAWNLKGARFIGNRISEARDGIYLSFTDGVLVADNVITHCRYGLHSMYSQNARFERNESIANLLGAALMLSDRLELRGNRIQQHRSGAAAYGVLLKDIGDLIAEDNEIIGNRVGIYAESVPSTAAKHAVLVRNVVAGNEVGFALQSNVVFTATDNRIADNLTDVRSLGRQLSPEMKWSRDGRGNSWGQYRGFDADRDGVGDVPYRLDDAMDAMVRRNPLMQAFLYTPAHLALEAAARMFPLFRQAPVLVDDRPLMTSPLRGAR